MVIQMMSLPRGTFLAFSGEITKDKLGNVSGDRRTPLVPRKGEHHCKHH